MDHDFDPCQSLNVNRDGQAWEIINCRSCGFWHTYPYPDLNYLKEFYQRDYIPPVRNGNFTDRVEELEQLSPFPGRLLEIGCGDGELLSLFQKHGWQTVGIEPSKQDAAAARMKGLTVVEATFENALPQVVGQFDVAMIIELLEHYPNPDQLCRIIHDRLLCPGGLLYVEVPNDFNEFQRTFIEVTGKDPWWIAPPAHLNYFNFSSLRRLLERTGFHILVEEGTFPMELFLLQGMDYVGNTEVGKRAHGMRLSFENMLNKTGRNELRRRFYRALAGLGLGRQIVMIARKLAAQ